MAKLDSARSESHHFLDEAISNTSLQLTKNVHDALDAKIGDIDKHYFVLLQKLEEANNAKTVLDFSDEDIDYLNRVLDINAPRMYISVDQSLFFELRDHFFQIPISRLEAVRNHMIRNRQVDTIIEGAISDFAKEKGWSLNAASATYEFSRDSSQMMELLKENRRLLVYQKLGEKLKTLLGDDIERINSMMDALVQANKDRIDHELNDGDKEFINSHYDYDSKRFYFDVSKSSYSDEIDKIMKESWALIQALRNTGSVDFIGDVLPDIMSDFEDIFRWKLCSMSSSIDLAGIPTTMRIVKMADDELTQREQAEQEAREKQGGVGRAIAGVRGWFSRNFLGGIAT